MEATTPLLTLENYRSGVLVDDEWMAGITEHPDHPEAFMAYVVRHSTGESVAAHLFQRLEEALDALNRIPRAWAFAKTMEGGGCGSGSCGGGSCGSGGGGCGGNQGGCGGCA